MNSRRDTARLAAILRTIPLEKVAGTLGYHRDSRDKARWKRPGSILSINGSQFYDHLNGRGGGGAIDLVIHAEGAGFHEALAWLERLAPAAGSDPWPHVRTWLIHQRGLDPGLVDACFTRQIIGADHRTNAVFVTRNAWRKHTGAELVGTTGIPFKGMAKGSRKSRGGFWLSRPRPQVAILVESAIDVLSACKIEDMKTIDLFVSTAGVAVDLPPWMEPFRLTGVFCGYDADEPGDEAAHNLIRNHPAVRRMRPDGAKDWNDILRMRTGGA